MTAGTLRVLTYHRVLPAGSGVDPRLVSASPEVFDRQMRYLATRYRPVSAEAALEAARGRASLPARAVLVTFDDAYSDFATVAWPILRRHGVPAAVFVATGYPDRPDREFWWDRLYRAFTGSRRPLVDVPGLGVLPLNVPEATRASVRATQDHLKRMPHEDAVVLAERLIRMTAADPRPVPAVLGWAELRRLAAEGVSLCAHTRTHPALDRLAPDALPGEIAGSLDDLRREVGRALPIFAYPFGLHDDRVVDAVRQAGFELALTCRDGHNALPLEHPLRLRRTNITPRTTPVVFRLRLRRAFAYLDQWRHRAEAA